MPPFVSMYVRQNFSERFVKHFGSFRGHAYCRTGVGRFRRLKKHHAYHLRVHADAKAVYNRLLY